MFEGSKSLTIVQWRTNDGLRTRMCSIQTADALIAVSTFSFVGNGYETIPDDVSELY